MATNPYFLILEAVLGANAQATLQHSVPNPENLMVHSLVIESTGAFNINDIRTTDGVHYTNASSLKEIPSSVFLNGGNENNGFGEFPVPINVGGGASFYIDIEDASGATNTVTFVLACTRET